MDEIRRRIKNIIRRMVNGEEFYTNRSPRISRAEIKEIDAIDVDLWLQTEHTHGAQPGPIAVYPLHKDKFKERAKSILESINSKSNRTDRDG